jgi:hypothetical protein
MRDVAATVKRLDDSKRETIRHIAATLLSGMLNKYYLSDSGGEDLETIVDDAIEVAEMIMRKTADR